MRFNPATGRLMFPDPLHALERERIQLAKHNVELAMIDLDVRVAATKLLAKPQPAVEVRSAAATAVDTAARTITVVAVPYEQPAQVPYRGTVWTEVFERGAFDGIEQQRQVRVNRDHDKSRTVGKVTRFDARDRRGLIAEIRIASTVLGDETLALAAEDMLSASVGFMTSTAGVHLNPATRTRRVRRATLDHLSLVESPAYDGAHVVGVA